MKHLLLFLVLAAVSRPLSAAPIDEAAARDEAARFLSARFYAPGQKNARAVSGALRAVERTSAAYLFTDGARFVLASADDRLPAILGYGSASPGTLPPAMSGMVSAFARILRLIGTAVVPAQYDGPVVQPLLGATVRHQNAPHNGCCPFYTADDGTVSTTRCVVGCVATALEEIISYYRRVVVLRDTLHGWTTPHYVISDVMPGTAVDTRLILHNYDTPAGYTPEAADAVSRLSYYCGMAAHMNWGLSESGAHVSALAEPLRRAFGFGYVHYADSYKYRPADWLEMVRGEICAGRPVLYAGFSSRLHGHAFVLDGIDDAGFFHVNWGVGGDYDGYFRLDVLNAAEPAGTETPEGMVEGYACNQEALFLYPDVVVADLPDTIRRTGRELIVDSVRADLTPAQWRHVPMRMWVRNTADYAVTTPLEIFTNAPTDTAWFEQGDYVALAGVTMAPGKRRALSFYGVIAEMGKRILRISPDDVQVVYEMPLTVHQQSYSRLTFGTPVAVFPKPGEVVVLQPLANAADAGQAGDRITYEIYEQCAGGERRMAHQTCCLLAPGEAVTDTIRFAGLEPGADCVVYVRFPWTIRHELRFTLPEATSVEPVFLPAENRSVEPWYDLSGRRVAVPHRGMYIRGGQKVMVP